MGDVATEVLTFAAETGVESIPDMVSVVYTLPLYVAARTGEMADERARNKGMEEPGAQEYFEAIPFALGSALLERFGAKGIIGLKGAAKETAEEIGKGAIRKGIEAAAKQGAKGLTREGMTEFFQEGVIEYVGEKFGTDAALDWREGLEKGAWASLAGGVYGGVAGATVGAAKADYKTQPELDVKTDKPIKGEEIISPSEDLVEETKLNAKDPASALHSVGRWLWEKPVQGVRTYRTPATDWIADRFFSPTRADAPITQTNDTLDIVQGMNMARGKFINTDLNNILEPLRNRIGNVPSKLDQRLVRALRLRRFLRMLLGSSERRLQKCKRYWSGLAGSTRHRYCQSLK